MNKDFDEDGPLPASRPLGIKDLLFFTAIVAVSLAFSEFVDRLQANSSLVFSSQSTFERIAMAVGHGASITGLAWLFLNFRVTGKFCCHPGHWLILISAATLPLVEVANSIVLLHEPYLQPYENEFRLYGILLVFIHALSLTIWIVAIANSINSVAPIWTTGFVFGAITDIVLLLMWVLVLSGWTMAPIDSMLRNGVPVRMGLFTVFGVCMVAAVTSDQLQGLRHDWLHWLGVSLQIVARCLLPALFWISYLSA